MNVKENIHNIHRSNFQKGRGDGRKNMLCDFFQETRSFERKVL